MAHTLLSASPFHAKWLCDATPETITNADILAAFAGTGAAELLAAWGLAGGYGSAAAAATALQEAAAMTVRAYERTGAATEQAGVTVTVAGTAAQLVVIGTAAVADRIVEIEYYHSIVR